MSNYCRARAARNLVYIVSFAIVRRWSEDNWKTTVRAAGATHMAGWRLRRLSASAHLRNESRRQTTTSRATERFVSIERRNGAPHPTSSNYNWSAATTDRPTDRLADDDGQTDRQAIILDTARMQWRPTDPRTARYSETRLSLVQNYSPGE